MKKSIIFISIFLAIIGFLIFAFSKKPAEKAETKISPLQALSKEELIERIRYMLEVMPEIEDLLPGIKGKDLQKMDKDTLIALHNRINNERVRIQTERIQRQLEAVRASQHRPPQAPPTLPKVPQLPPAPPPQPQRR